MAGLMINGSMIQGLVYNGNPVSAMYNGQFVWPIDTPAPGPSFSTVTIGNQVWTDDDIKIDDGLSGITKKEVYDQNGNSLGEKYFYTWDAAMRVASGIDGWHLPTYNEINTLNTNVSNISYIKSTSGWYSGANGNNLYGFNLTPAGCLNGYGESYRNGYAAYFWTSNETRNVDAFQSFVYFEYTSIARPYDYKTNSLPVRLIKD